MSQKLSQAMIDVLQDNLQLHETVASLWTELQVLRQHLKFHQAHFAYPAFVECDGILTLPNAVSKHLNLEKGGPVIFDISFPSHVYLMPEEQYMQKIHDLGREGNR